MGPFASSLVKFETIGSSKKKYLKAAIANKMVLKFGYWFRCPLLMRTYFLHTRSFEPTSHQLLANWLAHTPGERVESVAWKYHKIFPLVGTI
jgi:hypothetical protein